MKVSAQGNAGRVAVAEGKCRLNCRRYQDDENAVLGRGFVRGWMEGREPGAALEG